MAFSTKALTLEQWMWCLFFGVGTLLWGQVITTIPTRKIPKILSWGRGQPDDIGAINLGDEKFDPDSDKKPRTGQILWIRGLTRLQTQLRVIRAFKSTLEDLEERRSVHSLHSLHSMRSSRSHTGPRPLSDFTYIDEDPTNTALNASKGNLLNKSADQEHVTARMNSSTSPLLLAVTGPTGPTAPTGPANAYNHHHNTTTINTTNDTRSSSNSAPNQAQQPNHTQMQSSNNRDSNTGNSLLLSSNNLALPELTKLVHETSI